MPSSSPPSTPCSPAPTSASSEPQSGAPRANAIAERFIGTLRRECLDHLLITGPRHLTVVLQEYIEHYNTHRPHRSLHQQPPTGATSPPSRAAVRPLRRDRLGGLVHEYVQVA